MRPEKLENEIKAVIDGGDKPSAERLAEEMGWPESDVHRCLNILEKRGRVNTYSKEVIGSKMRMVALRR